MLHWEYAEDIHKGAGLYSLFHLRPANVQPGQPGAELPARPAGSKAPGNLGFMRKNTAADRTPCNSDPLLGGVGTTWQELAAGQ